MSLSTFSTLLSLCGLPEELLERILEECIPNLIDTPALNHSSPFPSRSTSPRVSPANSKRSSPCASPSVSRHATPAASPSRSRPPSPGFPVSSHTDDPSAVHSSASCNSGLGVAASHDRASILDPLLVSRLFHRIFSPLLFRSIALTSRSQTQKLLEGNLRHHPERARWIRRLVITGIWEGVGEVLKIVGSTNAVRAGCWSKGKGRELIDEDWGSGGLQALEITIDLAPLPQRPPHRDHQQLPTIRRSTTHSRHAGNVQTPGATLDVDASEFCEGLLALADSRGGGISGLKRLVLRKPQDVYLTHQRAKMVIGTLANLVDNARALESAHIAFRLSDDPVPVGSRRTQGSPMIAGSTPTTTEMSVQPIGPIMAFTTALSQSPSLRTLITPLPSVWNETLLRMSTNDALERIILVGGGGKPVSLGGDWRGGYYDDRGPGVSVPLSRLVLPIGTPIPPQARPLPSNPVERVYAASTRGCDGYAAGVVRPGSNLPRQPPIIPGRPGGAGTGLFMNEARKHERLCALIHAGSMTEGESTPVQQKVPISPPPPFHHCDDNTRPIAPTANGIPPIAIPKPGLGKTPAPPLCIVASDPVLQAAGPSEHLQHQYHIPSSAFKTPGIYASCSSWISAKFS